MAKMQLRLALQLLPKDIDISPERYIAVAAYYRAEQRGFVPGYELDDWLAAEREILALHADAHMRARTRPHGKVESVSCRLSPPCFKQPFQTSTA